MKYPEVEGEREEGQRSSPFVPFLLDATTDDKKHQEVSQSVTAEATEATEATEADNNSKHLQGSIVYLIICTILVFSIFFGAEYPQIILRKHYLIGTCVSQAFTVQESRCCKKSDCSCTECDITKYPLCSEMLQQSSNRSTCCGDPQCCRTCCTATCCHQSCSGSSGEDRRCRQVCSCCSSECCSRVSRNTCPFRCGTCFQTTLSYYLDLPGTENDMHNLSRLFTCGLDDYKCQSQYQTKYGKDKQWDCWYDRRHPAEGVRFSGEPKHDIAAIVFTVIFGLCWIVSFCFTIYFVYVRRFKKEK